MINIHHVNQLFWANFEWFNLSGNDESGADSDLHLYLISIYLVPKSLPTNFILNLPGNPNFPVSTVLFVQTIARSIHNRRRGFGTSVPLPTPHDTHTTVLYIQYYTRVHTTALEFILSKTCTVIEYNTPTYTSPFLQDPSCPAPFGTLPPYLHLDASHWPHQTPCPVQIRWLFTNTRQGITYIMLCYIYML